MFNPITKVLGLIVLATGIFVTGYLTGKRHADNACEAAQLQVAHAHLEQSRKDIEAAAQSAKREGEREALAKSQSTQIMFRGIQDAQTKTDPSCNLGAESFSLLKSAVGFANGEADTVAMPDPLPNATGSAK